jgi:microcystin-dependent protein
MVEQTTLHYGWIKPEVTKSASTWGGYLNNDLDAIDALIWANAQGANPIGAMMMFGGSVAPANWMICNGASLDRTTYATLYGVIGTYFGAADGTHFSLPNLVNNFPMGANGASGLGGAGGAATVTLSTAQMPVHSHGITDVAHNHSVNDPTHNHTISQSVHGHGDPTHAHGVSSAYQDAHAHNLTRNPLSNFAGANVAAGANWGFGDVDTDAQQPAVHVAIAAAATGIQANNANVSNVAAATGVSVNASGALIYGTNNAGSGGAIENRPPYQQLNFIIRYQ